MSDAADLIDRVAELEQHAERLILAGDPRDQGGSGAWHNHIETRLHQERSFLTDVVAHALAGIQKQIIDACNVLITERLSQRVRGTFNATAKYSFGDVVALDGGSFLAKCDNPGACPGGNWQLIARQGARGIAGPKGERGPAGKTIVGWIVDRSCYRITPRMSDNTLGAPLELGALFEPENTP
jgi:hypothetical protein